VFTSFHARLVLDFQALTPNWNGPGKSNCRAADKGVSMVVRGERGVERQPRAAFGNRA
jgi:hypothetical protein